MKTRTVLIMLTLFNVCQPAFAEIQINISVDWEGRSITANNLRAIEAFNQEFGKIPVLHFLNAAYFTKPDVNFAQVAREMRSALDANDVVGLHIHAWKSLMTSAGVEYRNTPNWNSGAESCDPDCGHGVPLTAYATEELQKVIRYSADTLVQQGFPRPIAFRAGGWMANLNVMQALAANKFRYDYSGLNRDVIRGSQPEIYRWTANLWSHITNLTQPYVIEAAANLIEVPNNGCLADYMPARKMIAVWEEYVRAWQANPRADYFISFGFHQETAAVYSSRVAEALRVIIAAAAQRHIPLSFVAYPK